MTDRLCPYCGAANLSSAEWCNQCFTRFDADREVHPAPAQEDGQAAAAPSSELKESAAGWLCERCDTPNPLEATECSVCGTSIYRSFGHESDGVPTTTPESALLWAIVPGLGHAKAGQGVLGFSLGLLIVITIVFGALFGSSDGTRSLGLLLILIGVGLWLVSALDAYRWATGEGANVWLRPRVVTVLAAVIIGFMLLAFVVTGTRVGRQ